jgi:hypothetical protein
LSNHRVFWPSCSQTLAFTKLPVNNVKQSRLQYFTCSASYCQICAVANMLRQQKNFTFFNFERFSMLYHTLQSCTCSAPSH